MYLSITIYAAYCELIHLSADSLINRAKNVDVVVINPVSYEIDFYNKKLNVYNGNVMIIFTKIEVRNSKSA